MIVVAPGRTARQANYISTRLLEHPNRNEQEQSGSMVKSLRSDISETWA